MRATAVYLTALFYFGCSNARRDFGSTGDAGADSSTSDAGSAGEAGQVYGTAGEAGSFSSGGRLAESAAGADSGGSGAAGARVSEPSLAGGSDSSGTTAGGSGDSGEASAGISGSGAAGAAASTCGDGHVDPGEACDLGKANDPNAYGPGLCSNQCKIAPYCGDGVRNGSEACDNGATGATDLGSCNFECTGFYEKKLIVATPYTMGYSTDLGGIAGADSKCVSWFKADYKALLVGATRRATVTPLKGDQQLDWVIQKYRYYYNWKNELIWRTDDVALLGVRDGKRLNTYADAWDSSFTSDYPWSGYGSDWTTFDDSITETTYQGTCHGWTSVSGGYGSFAFEDLTAAASELCNGSSSFILCVEQ